MTIMVVKDTSIVQACWVGVDFDTTVDAGVDDEVWLDTATILFLFFWISSKINVYFLKFG